MLRQRHMVCSECPAYASVISLTHQESDRFKVQALGPSVSRGPEDCARRLGTPGIEPREWSCVQA